MNYEKLTKEELILLKEQKTKEFEARSYDTFCEYGVQDVALLIELDDKLKLVDLAKYLAYLMGVTMNDVRGTLKQWHAYVFNESFKLGMVLPLDNKYDKADSIYLKKSLNLMKDEITTRGLVI